MKQDTCKVKKKCDRIYVWSHFLANLSHKGQGGNNRITTLCYISMVREILRVMTE